MNSQVTALQSRQSLHGDKSQVLLTYRGITVASALARWVWDVSAGMWDSSPDPEATLSPGCTPAIDHRRRFGRDVVGVREYRGRLVAVIAVDGPADAPSGHQRQAESSATLPVAAVATALRQFDVRLDAIDIVSVRNRHVCEAADPSAPRTVDDRPAGIERGTWLVLRMDPQRNVPAVAARDSVAATAERRPPSGSPAIWMDGAARPGL